MVVSNVQVLTGVLLAIVAAITFNLYPIIHELNISSSQTFEFDMTSIPSSVFVLGATGEVGKEIVKALARNPQIKKVTLIGRRQTDLPSDENYKKFTQQIIDFDKLSEYSDVFKGHDVGISSLGTTRGKSGADGFYKVDHDYVVNTAKLAKEGGTKHFSLVSSGSANKDSNFLYLKVKGQVEEEITQLDFDKLFIYHPGFLLCDRKERRMGEYIARNIVGFVDRWRTFSIETSVVGIAIVKNIFNTNAEKVTIVNNSDIRNLGKEP